MRIAASFLTSAVDERGWPPPDRPELAFAGRSNVGKSSMLNRLTGVTGLARVSNTPGRTRTLNFYDLRIDRGAKKDELRFCDLPGYGFAKVSKAERKQWAEMIERYLTRREPLRAVISLVDANVGPTDDDLEAISWFAEIGRAPLVVATKIDKLPKAKRADRLRAIEKQLGIEPRASIGFSAVEGLGREELWGRILELASA